MEPQALINIAYTVALISITAGGLRLYRYSMHKTVQEITRSVTEVQERANNALQSEINTLKDKVTELEKENARHRQTIGLIKRALSKRGLTITIDGDLVSISDDHGVSIHQRIEEAS